MKEIEERFSLQRLGQIDRTDSSLYIPCWSLGRWTPKAHDPTMTLQLREAFESGLYTDVSFRVENVIMNAHRLILSWKAPTIAKLIEDAGEDDIIDIPGVHTPESFRSMLYFIYADNVSTFHNLGLNDLIELLTLANRFSVYKLKIVLEDFICKTHLTKDNAFSLLLLADSKNCYIMYEATVSLIVQHMSTMMGKEEQCKDLLKSAHLVTTIMLAAREYDPESANECSLPTFGDIYHQLEQAGKLTQDGTRAMLKKLLPVPTTTFGGFGGTANFGGY